MIVFKEEYNYEIIISKNKKISWKQIFKENDYYNTFDILDSICYTL